MKIAQLGEFGLIDLLDRMIAQETQLRPGHPASQEYELIISIGDDAAAWRSPKGVELCTTDTVVEGVHFTVRTTPWRDLGWKVMAANLSDIAAMGGAPLYAVVTLGLPEDMQVKDVEDLYHGMLEAGNRFGARIVGGDTVRSPVTFVTVALTGVQPGNLLRRSAAHPGELVAVTGDLGSSAGGLEVLLGKAQASDEEMSHLAQRHRRPQPRITEGLAMSQRGVKAAIDVSDGLVDDLSKMCRASGVAAQLHTHKVPVHPFLKKAFPTTHLDLALYGGEDYELLFTVNPAEDLDDLARALPSGLSVIGEICEGAPGSVVLLDEESKVMKRPGMGWDHFRTKA